MKNVGRKIRSKTKWILAFAGVLVVITACSVAFLFFQIDEAKARKIADENVPSDAEFFGVDVYEDELIRRYDYTYITGSDYFKFSVNGFGGIFDERKEATSDPSGENTLAIVTTIEDEQAMKEAPVSKEKAEAIALENSRPNSTILGSGFKESSGHQYYDFVIKSSDGIYRVMIDSENEEVLWNAKVQ